MNFDEFQKQLKEKQEELVKAEADFALKQEELGKFLAEYLGVSPRSQIRIEDVANMIERIIDMKGRW